VLVVGLLVLVAGALVLWRPHSAPSRAPGLSVLLISIDTLRFDALGSYGKAQAGTPWMDRLAEEGVRFERAYAHNVVTLPSHANMLSGLYPHEHGVRDNAGFRFPRTLPTLATLLKQAGYRTGAFVSAFPLDSRFGLDAGFDVYDDAFLNVDADIGRQVQQRAGPETVERARRWLEAAGAGPSFCFVHLYEPHFPYAPYQADVAAADRALEPLLRPLLERAADGRMLVVLTSDHGEGLGEHGEATHGIFAYEATLRVPLLLYAPRLFRPRVVPGVARHVDIAPTVLDALALSAPASLRGTSLLAAAQSGAAVDRASYFEALTGAFSRGWAPLYGILDGGLKYIALPTPELYDVVKDPREQDNLHARKDVSRLRQLLQAERAKDAGARGGKEPREVRERLSALGYLGGAAPEPGRSEDDDPKRLIELDAALQRAATAEVEGRSEEAIALVSGVIRQRPRMALAHVQLARLLRASGRLREALDALRRALEIQPGDAVSAALLGAYLNEAGRPGEVIAALQPFAASPEPDVDVLVALGMALAGVDRRAEAKQTFEAARRADPSDAMLTVNLATVYMLGREDARAGELLREVVAQRPDLFRAWNALGVIAARGGRPDEAAAHWEKALAIDPDAFDTLYNLGSLLWEQGRREAARGPLQRFVARAPRQQYAADVARVQRWLQSPP
jgi:tetratricopeptide (TPR) repeat protein